MSGINPGPTECAIFTALHPQETGLEQISCRCRVARGPGLKPFLEYPSYRGLKPAANPAKPYRGLKPLLIRQSISAPAGKCSRLGKVASPAGFEPRVYAMSVASSWAAGRRGLCRQAAISSLTARGFPANAAWLILKAWKTSVSRSSGRSLAIRTSAWRQKSFC
jgi:hypothetical protein